MALVQTFVFSKNNPTGRYRYGRFFLYTKNKPTGVTLVQTFVFSQINPKVDTGMDVSFFTLRINQQVRYWYRCLFQ
jgi:hypothetical protein